MIEISRLHFIALEMTAEFLCLEYRKEKINYYFKCWMTVHLQQLLNLELLNFLLKNRLLDTSNFSIAFQNLILEVTIMELFWMLNVEWLFIYNNFWTFNFQTFYSKTDFSIHKIFSMLSKIWYSKWPILNFFEFWILNDCSCTTTFEPSNFQTFYSKQTSRYIKFFHYFPKFVCVRLSASFLRTV